MKKMTLIAMFAALCVCASATVPNKCNIPNIPGYVTLKGDFHNHTVFSDGTVWPTTRIEEAYYDDLDIISITDHAATRHRKQVQKGYFNGDKCDFNASYELARDAAKKYGILVIHGIEVTNGARIFPGHFNTHFITDGNAVTAACESQDAVIKDKTKKEEAGIFNALTEARKQGSFNVWNHPNWDAQAPNETKWWDIQTRVYEAGMMQGIEIINQLCGFCPEAFHWAMEKDLTIVSGTDCHDSMSKLVAYMCGEYRPMTLVFAKERTLESVREALENHRTAVFCDGCVYGKAEFLEPLVKACVEMSEVKYSKDKISFSLKNVSSVPVRLVKVPGEGGETVIVRRDVTLNPGEELNMSLKPVGGESRFAMKSFNLKFQVANFFVDVDKPLELSCHFENTK